MDIKSLASSSAGNAYIISDGKTTILIDCGLPYKELNKRAGFILPTIDACFISHEHKDHSTAISEILGAGIDTYVNQDMFNHLNLKKHHRAKICGTGDKITVGTFIVTPLAMKHDVLCLGFYIYSHETKERLFFAIDTFAIPFLPAKCDYLMIEINYQQEIIDRAVNSGKLETTVRNRVMRSHHELNTALEWLKKVDKSKLRHIYIMHLSGGNADAAQVKKEVMKVTGVPTTIFDE